MEAEREREEVGDGRVGNEVREHWGKVELKSIRGKEI
jgi:hypothetical protein